MIAIPRASSFSEETPMRTCRSLLLVAGALAAAGLAVADDQSEARKIVDRGIKAQGGPAKVAAFKNGSARGKGTLHQMGMMIPFAMEVRYETPGRLRTDLDLDIGGQNVKVSTILNGDKGWLKIGDMVQDMTEDQVAESKAQLYSFLVTGLVVLSDKAFSLSPLGEMKIDDRPAVGVRVSHKDRRDINLFFDKETGLLCKSQWRVKDLITNEEQEEETLYSDFKEQDGVKQSMKIKILRDGKPFMDFEASDSRAEEKFEENVFAKPD
jgi:hypothetical protein